MRGTFTAERAYELTGEDMERAGVGPRYWDASLTQVPGALPYAQFLKNWLRDLHRHLVDGHGLLLYGEWGTGKTCLTVVIIKEVLARGGTAVKVSAAELSRYAIENTPFDEESSWMQRISSVDMLVIDDLGAEHDSGWSRSVIERVVRARVEARRAIVISTNAGRANFAQMLGAGVAEVLREAVFPVEVAGVNWRKAAADKMTEQMKLYLVKSA